ncbi:MAG TPA: sigma-70 family RNA polymerase sigma factor [Gemmataceae bacterium]|nr:sigma-70 family RNA polymerase sigma factor [Gemmataceae bacterium]
MAPAQLGTVLRYIHTLAHGQNQCNSADGELLRQFTLHRDQPAFAALVRRHGRLVWGVCRHVLRHDQDAEDAFQATFLVLALKAGSIRKQETVASWLHGAAYRRAMQIKRKAARRRAHEDRARQDRSGNSSSEEALRDLQELLDLEVQRLPDKYRAPFVLCCLEGMSKAEAASQLGWKEGTVSGRLARARLQLLQRLAKQGVALSAALSVAALATTAASAAPPAELVQATVRTMMAVVQQGTLSGVVSTEIVSTVRGVSRALAAAKIKVITALLLMAGAAAGSATVLLQPAGVVQQAVAKQEALEAPGQEADQVIAEPQTSARTDLYGDPLPPGAIARMGTVRLRQGSSTAYLSAAASPDGKFIATSGDDSIRLWNASTGKLLWRMNTPRYGALLFSPDGKWLAVPSAAGGVCLLDPATGRLERRLPDAAQCHTFSPDSRFLVTQGKKGTLIVWDTATGKQTHCLECGAGGQDEGATAAYTPDGKTLVTLSLKRRLCRWNLATGNLRKSVTLSLPRWRTLGLSPDGRTLAVVPGSKEAVQLWDTESGTERLKLQGELACSWYGLAFTADSKTLATNWTREDSGKDVLSIWDTGTGKLQRRFELPGRALGQLDFMPDGRTLLSAPGGPLVRLWDTMTGRELLQWPAHQQPVTSVCFMPDGRSLLSGSYDGTVRLWDTANGQFRRTLSEQYGSANNGIAVLQDGKTMLASCDDGAVRLYDIATGKVLDRLPVEDDPKASPERTCQVRWLVHHGQTVAVYSARSHSPLEKGPHAFFDTWDIITGKRLLRRPEEEDNLQVLALSPDARIYASYIDGSTGPQLPVKADARLKKGSTVPPTGPAQVVLKETATGRRLLTLPQPDQYGHQQAFSQDGRTLVTATYRIRYEGNQYVYDRHALHFWELATGKERLRITAPETGRESCFASLMFSPDGRMLASVRGTHTSGMIQFWDVATGNELLRRTGYDAPVYVALAFSLDGKTLASAHGDGTILLWDLSEARQALKRAPVVANETQVEGWWAELKDADAPKAYVAAWKLIAAPEEAVRTLRKHLVPATSVSSDNLRQLLDDLDSNQFALRKAATQELAVLEELAIPALREALGCNPSAEKRQRIEALLALPRIVRSRVTLQNVRAVEVLEQIATPEAKEVLATLARGAPAARLTQEARASLERLKRGGSPVP